MNKYIVVTTLNRETSVDFAETIEQAKEIMRADYEETLDFCGGEEECNDYDISEMSAYISADDLHYDIEIFEVLNNNEKIVIDEDLEYFMEKWNDENEVITSLDIGGYNYELFERHSIDTNNLDKVVAVVLDDEDDKIKYTTKVLLNLFKQDKLRVYKEVPYI